MLVVPGSSMCNEEAEVLMKRRKHGEYRREKGVIGADPKRKRFHRGLLD